MCCFCIPNKIGIVIYGIIDTVCLLYLIFITRHDPLVKNSGTLVQMVNVMTVITSLPVMAFVILFFRKGSVTITRIYSKILNYKLILQGFLYPVILVKFNHSSFAVRWCAEYQD